MQPVMVSIHSPLTLVNSLPLPVPAAAPRPVATTRQLAPTYPTHATHLCPPRPPAPHQMHLAAPARVSSYTTHQVRFHLTSTQQEASRAVDADADADAPSKTYDQEGSSRAS